MRDLPGIDASFAKDHSVANIEHRHCFRALLAKCSDLHVTSRTHKLVVVSWRGKKERRENGENISSPR